MERRYEEDWQEVGSHRHRRNDYRYNLPDIATQKERRLDRSAYETSYYFSKIPDHFGAWEMFKVFKNYGNIQEVVIPAKKNRLGRRFGFARFVDVYDEKRFGIELDNIIIGRDKIFVNPHRFQRRDGNHRATNDKNHKTYREREEKGKSHKNEEVHPRSDRNDCSFAKVVQKHNEAPGK
ncbi:RNA-binding protein 25-like, partial [Trifolium medium]|nr:RNA-binding protein 25-like [Trifolium medium]